LAFSVTLSERCYVLIFVLARFGRGLFIVLAFSVTLSERCYVLIFVLARFGRGAVIIHNHQPQPGKAQTGQSPNRVKPQPGKAPTGQSANRAKPQPPATIALPRGVCLAALTGVEPLKRSRQELVL
jgi:hypothetical protein